MGIVKRVITHPSWDRGKPGDIIKIDEKDLTPRIESLTKPYEPEEVTEIDLTAAEEDDGDIFAENKPPENKPVQHPGRKRR